MIKEARNYLVDFINPEKNERMSINEFLASDTGLNLEEEIAAVCLMDYYIQPKNDLLSSLARHLFTKYRSGVRENIMETVIGKNSEFYEQMLKFGFEERNVSAILLTNDFLPRVKELMTKELLEKDIELVVKILYEEYFC